MKTHTRTPQYGQEKGCQYEERNMNNHSFTLQHGQEKGWQYEERNMTTTLLHCNTNRKRDGNTRNGT